MGAWPYERSLGRAAKWDGIIATDKSSGNDEKPISPDVLARISAWMKEHRKSAGPFDIIVEGTSSGTDHAANRAMLDPLAEAGATWWIESRWEDETPDSLRGRIQRGPPHLS